MSVLLKNTLSAKYQSLFNKFGVNTTLRLSHFFGQASHESNLKPTSESLNYSATGLISGFGRHRISVADANKYGRTSLHSANQEAIGNLLYGGSWGKTNLGNTQIGDGYKYRGRGIFQITGRANYSALTKYAQGLGFKVDYISNPDLLLSESDSLIAALWYWNSRNLNKWADKDDYLRVSKVINLGNSEAKGTPKGLSDRLAKTNSYKKIFI